VLWTTANLARRFGVSKNTIRNWGRRFAAYLSPSAAPAHGEAREFSDEDVYIFAAIAYYSAQGLTYDEIDALLVSGAYLIEDIQIPEEPITDEVTAIQRYEQMRAVAIALQDERDRLLIQLEQLAREAGRSDELRRERNALLERVAELERLLGRLEAELAAQQRSWWRRLFG